MKRYALYAVAFICAGVAFGVTDMSKLPATVKRIDHLKEAEADAKQQKKALMFVMSEVTKNSPKLVLEATQQIFQKLRGQCVIVYLDFKADMGKLEKQLPEVNAAFNSEAAKGPIPRTVVTDATGQKIFAIIPYAPPGPLGEEMLKEARQQIQDALAGKTKEGADIGIAGTKSREISLPPTKKDKNQP